MDSTLCCDYAVFLHVYGGHVIAGVRNECDPVREKFGVDVRVNVKPAKEKIIFENGVKYICQINHLSFWS